MVVLNFDPQLSDEKIGLELKDINSAEQLPYVLIEKHIFTEYFIFFCPI